MFLSAFNTTTMYYWKESFSTNCVSKMQYDELQMEIFFFLLLLRSWDWEENKKESFTKDLEKS